MEEISPLTSLLKRHRTLLVVTLIALFSAAALVRVCAHQLQPSRILGERQYRSAAIARAYYFESAESVPDWRRRVASTIAQRESLEPPVTEYLTAVIYRVIGEESLNVARVLSSLFWLVGGVFLFAVAVKIVPLDSALMSLTYYLFVPFGIVISISILPEPLMIMMIAFSLFLQVRYFEKPTRFALVSAAVISGLAALIKPFCLFALFGSFVAMAIQKRGRLRALVAGDVFTFMMVVGAVGASYYIYAISDGDFLGDDFQSIFLPYLYLEPQHWIRWLLYAANAVGYAPLVAAVLGILFVPKGRPRALISGLCIGYLLFCLIYTVRVSFSSHCHLQLLIAVAFVLGPLVATVVNGVLRAGAQGYGLTLLTAAFILAVVLSLADSRNRLNSYHELESPQTAAAIGKIVKHSISTVYVASFYGAPLEYYGQLSGTYWPRRKVNVSWIKDRKGGIIDYEYGSSLRRITGWIWRRFKQRDLSIEERMDALGFQPEYFVISDLRAFHQHHQDLKDFLEREWVAVADTKDYLVYAPATR
jgi:hypothetical protein